MSSLRCDSCSGRFFLDLPAGHGLLYPYLLDAASGEVAPAAGREGSWFAEQLQRAYDERSGQDISISVEERRPVRRPVLVNCMDSYYGHALLKLLNVEHHLERGDDVIAMVPNWLRWMVPADVAAVWTLDVALPHAWRWFESVDNQLHELVGSYEAVTLCAALPHPHPRDVDVSLFTGVAPAALLADRADPVVTIVLRRDRRWGPSDRGQLRRVARLGRLLRARLPTVDLAVVGVGEAGAGPSGIADLRESSPDVEAERAWCRRYAASDVVIGVHGSNMLLPSAHARVTVELLPDDRLGNLGQDLLVPESDPRLALVRARFLPIDATPAQVALVVVSAIEDLGSLVETNGALFADHAGIERLVDAGGAGTPLPQGRA